MADITWIIDSTNGGYPYPSGCPAPESKPMDTPYPLMLWRITAGVNSGYPYFLLQPEAPPAPVTPKGQRKYICVYAKDTDKLQFSTNGLAILTPTSCEVQDTVNSMRCVQMVHPIDPDGKWKLLTISSILKVNDQLYTIKRVMPDFVGASGSVTVYAEDIWYQQADGWLFPDDQPITSTTGQAALNGIAFRTDYQYRQGAFIYSFTGTSDITGVNVSIDLADGRTPIDAILGSGGLVDNIGGELYRNNFTFSINQRMQGAQDDAFDIRIGKNLTGIQLTYDMSELCTYFRGYDYLGGWLAVAWDFEAFLGDMFPHYIVRSKKFDAPEGSNDEDFDYAAYFDGKFTTDVMAFFNRNCKPIIGYSIDIADVRSNPDFEIISAESLSVGDKGRVYDSRLGGTLTAEITGTTYDAVHDKVTKIMIGDRMSFVATSAPAMAVDFTASPIGYDAYVTDASGGICTDPSGAKITEERSYD